MSNDPVWMSKENLLAMLADIQQAVASGDSWEGSLEYLLPEEGDPVYEGFRVRAAWRVGNSMGQGGMRLVGTINQAREDTRGVGLEDVHLLGEPTTDDPVAPKDDG